MKDPKETDGRRGFSRRAFLQGAGGVAAASSFTEAVQAAQDPDASGASGGSGVERMSGATEVELRVNGAVQKVRVEPRTTLLNALRNHAEPPLTGTKLVCGEGACGACTVLVDGRARYSCMMLAADAVGREVRTVEGLAQGDELSTVQEAFCEKDALMCGFCTPGFLMSSTGLLERKPDATRAEIQHALSGNFCRCGTQPHIFEAVAEAGRRLQGGGR